MLQSQERESLIWRKMKFSFIVPYFNKWGLTHRCLADFYKFLPNEDIEVILVDDASTDYDCTTGADWWMEKANPFSIKLLKHIENGGFGKSMNDGAEIATGDVLVFYSNDVRMSGNFLSELRNLLAKDDKVLVGNEVIYYPGGWNEFDVDGKHIVIPYANGWFLACTREVWNNLGGFDYQTFGRFDYEDMDISVRAYELGYNVVALNSKKIVHAHQGSTVETFSIDRMAHTKQNRIKFIAKWAEKLTDITIRLEGKNDGKRSGENT